MKRQGINVQTFDLSVRTMKATEQVAQRLQIEPETRVLRLDRLRGWEGEPIVHFRSYLHPRLELTRDADYQQPLYDVIANASGVIADRSQEEMTAVAASVQLAKRLRVRKGTPLLQRKRVVFDAGDRPIEYAVVNYESSRFALTLQLRREQS
jgi:GntR family transcriptional regulator